MRYSRQNISCLSVSAIFFTNTEVKFLDSYYITIDAIQILLAKSNGFYLISWSNQNRTAISKEELARILASEFGITKREATNYVADLN